MTMNMSKKVLSLALCLALLLVTLPCAFAEESAAAGTHRLRLGSSIYTIELDDSYVFGEIREEEIADDMIAYLYSDKLGMDIDIYQFTKQGRSGELVDYVYEEAAYYDSTTELVADGEVNGIPAGMYRTSEEYDGEFYDTVTYILDNGDEYVDIVFWLDSEDEMAEVNKVINTLDYVSVDLIQLGTSPYYVVGLSSFVEGELTEEDIADDQVAYWTSEETLLDFDVYQFSKEGVPENLADYVNDEANTYENVSEIVPETTLNGIPVGWYRTTETYKGVDYKTVTCIIDDGDQYVELVLWLDGLTAEREANSLLQSLFKDTGDAESEDGEAAPAQQEAGEEEAEEENAGEDKAEEAPAQAEPEGDAPGTGETYPLQLGTSAFYLDVPVGYRPGVVTEEDAADDQVGYYYSDDSAMDFDVYQFSKDGYSNTLAEYVVEESEGYTVVKDLVTDGEINGIPAAWYRTVEEYEEAEYETLTYILDNGYEYVDVVFWLDGATAEQEAATIINTLSVDEEVRAQNEALFTSEQAVEAEPEAAPEAEETQEAEETREPEAAQESAKE